MCNRFDEGAENQEWIIEEVPSARRDWSRPEGAVYNIINKSTGRRLGAQAANGPSPLQTASREFHWRIKPQTSLGGPCWLKPEGNSFCAELVAYNSGAPVGLRFEDYSDMQQWYFERIGWAQLLQTDIAHADYSPTWTTVPTATPSPKENTTSRALGRNW